jgi:hypothetical protein
MSFIRRTASHVTAILLALTLAAPVAPRSADLAAQVAVEPVDLDAVQRIREEGLERSHIEELARHLTEVIGPRLTGSPQMTEANQWTAEMLRSWGLENVVVEPWGEFGRGWEEVHFEGRIVEPFARPLHGRAVAWTGSTEGLVRGPAVIVEAESPEELDQYRGMLANAFLLTAPAADVEPEWEFRERRADADDLLTPVEARGGGQNVTAEQMQRWREARARRRAMSTALAELAEAEGAAAMLQISSRDHGVLRGGGSSAGRAADAGNPLPQVVLTREQYNTIWRNVEDGVPVEIEMEVRNRFFDDDLQAYNTLGAIPGTDLADEVVMIGAHLDSWHYGQGATDNASGSVVMMEALRILQELGLRPRRTIMIGLWSGEEQGLYGSEGWVANHPEMHDRISAYLNYDNGTGRIRGIWTQSNEKVIPIFEQILWPFRDLGVVAVRHGNTGSTDHVSFDRAGIPGFNFIQDPIEYGVRTHHTELDTYDHLVLDDLKQSAVVVAATIYHLAMRDEMVPRKAEEVVSDGS